MNPSRVSLVLLCILNVWTGGSATDCGEQQFEDDRKCCDQCPPGHYLKKFCTQSQPTVCSPCGEGYFSDRYNSFDRCKECQLCSQEYAEKCTPTTDAKCSCRNGFLCSNNACSKCEEKKCVTGEKVKRTEKSVGGELVEYSYECEALCPDNEYFDEKEDVCKPRTKCSVFGSAEQFPGNKTHNSICRADRQVNGMDKVPMILGAGFVLLSLTLLVLLLYTLIKRLMKCKTYDNSTDVTTDIAVFTKPSEVHLSQEECGLKLIIKDEIKVRDNPGHLHLGQETVFG